ncbi:sensor histidine kinase [Micromonospora sp. WMMD1128]|uniref:sensor histidine kinase n=1 Tax=unclassified Micromonospora TaxID=2617518 RepID=UPI00248B622E|nr:MULTISPECIES: sensor histidine kinase [unclassified Micromonospora]WBB73020.1 sensor histidine kinase [Micromonospora sp. WMMD1128]WFE33531.1 sensor histidine kinase [Micromonospora sp. WMMD975]
MTALLLTRRLRPAELAIVDAVLAVAVGGLLGPYAALESPLHGGVREPLLVSVIVGFALGLPLAVRRRWPITVAIVISSVATVALITGVIPNYAAAAPGLAIGLSFYTVAVSTQMRRSLLCAAGCLALVSVALVLTESDLWSRTGGVVYATVMIAPAWLIGWLVRERRAIAAREGEHLVRRTAAEERLRVARELHDVVAHTLSLIVVKAAVANHVAGTDPGEAGAALRVIEETGRNALTDVRRVLGALREETPYAPTPGLDELPALAQQAAIAGVDVRLDVRQEEPAAAVPESVGLGVYRIVQEAVTNVVKHAAPATCRATVTVTPREVRIEVTDDGRRPVLIGGEGHGLIGMRERATLHGGEFRAGPRSGGGYAVTATLPYRVAA